MVQVVLILYVQNLSHFRQNTCPEMLIRVQWGVRPLRNVPGPAARRPYALFLPTLLLWFGPSFLSACNHCLSRSLVLPPPLPWVPLLLVLALTASAGGYLRREIGPDQVAIGQIGQIRMQYRLLKQEDGSFTLRELLKAVYVLDNGLREVSIPRAWIRGTERDESPR